MAVMVEAHLHEAALAISSIRLLASYIYLRRNNVCHRSITPLQIESNVLSHQIIQSEIIKLEWFFSKRLASNINSTTVCVIANN